MKGVFSFYLIVRKHPMVTNMSLSHAVWHKMENFIRKAHLMVEGSVTQVPDFITYSSMVTRKTVHIALTMAL